MVKEFRFQHYVSQDTTITVTTTDQCCFTSKKCTSNNNQRAKKVVSNSLGLVHFAIGLVNSVFNLNFLGIRIAEEL